MQKTKPPIKSRNTIDSMVCLLEKLIRLIDCLFAVAGIKPKKHHDHASTYSQPVCRKSITFRNLSQAIRAFCGHLSNNRAIGQTKAASTF